MIYLLKWENISLYSTYKDSFFSTLNQYWLSLMKDSNFSIKIHDFLSKTTLEDTVYFSNKFSTNLPQLQDWLSCTIFIQSGDDKTLFMTITDIVSSQQKECDVCGESVVSSTIIDELYLKFYADTDEELLRENEINFSSKAWYIDLEDILVHEIILAQDLKNSCITCSKLPPKDSSEDIDTTSIQWVVNK